MVTALAAVSLASCGKKDAPTPAGPTIALEGLDITQVHEITGEPMTVKVNVKADAGIKTFAIRITSPLLTEELLSGIGLSAEMEQRQQRLHADALHPLYRAGQRQHLCTA